MKPRVALLAIVAAVGCGQSFPQIRLYRLSLPKQVQLRKEASADPGCATEAAPSLAIDELQVDAAYDDQRMAYRESEFRIEHYNYHEWSAPPGELLADALREGYESTRLFQKVEREWNPDASGILRGRVVALEEVDVTPRRWMGRLVLELELVPEDGADPLWSERFEIVRRLPERSPDGLAAATSAALAEIVAESAPQILASLSPERVPCIARSDSPRLGTFSSRG